MPESRMLINYVPGEECRVAIVEDGKLEEFYAERMSAVSRVGNIYVGRVTNVEPAIQAAFVDFGVGENGFLHVSDLHPRYFPGEDGDTTERVGKKTPRRERPPIQAALKKGMEIAVQVIKEGVGTKGPTLTSYLSIPGRFLVMMPQMDKVGVSRKVEDEEKRVKMREILDQLELPEGFGFIVRTAGMERTKAELKRDLAYLARLWKDMERRRGSGNRPRLLYSESDLLVRCLRDLHSTEMSEVIIDNELALKRASQFLKIVAPRGGAKLKRYAGQTPIYHAFGIEQQIAMMHSREVPLPSGGRLVIDETEALVAIDVNSGRMRDARDAETNAYRANLEAIEEICRQIRLRDVGGLIINDLIDMRDLKRRRDIEQRFKDRLKRDRARTTVLQISAFGILEMTRQRNRASHESQHFADCPTCHGRGLIQRPGSVAADALRELAAMLDHESIAKIEMVVSPRVAGELLSARRRALSRVERTSGKLVEVRVSEAVPLDRVTFYAYDVNGADVEVAKLQHAKKNPDIQDWLDESPLVGEVDIWDEEDESPNEPSEPDYEPTALELEGPGSALAQSDEAESEPAGDQGEAGKRGKRRRRRGGRGRGRQSDESARPQQAAQPSHDSSRSDPPVASEQADSPEHAPSEDGEEPHARTNELGEDRQPGTEGATRKRRRRRRRGGRGRNTDGSQHGPETQSDHPIAGTDENAESRSETPRHSRSDDAQSRSPDEASHSAESPSGENGSPTQAGGGGQRRRKRRRGGRGRGRENGERDGVTAGPQGASPEPSRVSQSAPRPSSNTDQPKPPAPAAKKEGLPRTLYATRRKLSPSEKRAMGPE
ncbi:MAG: Rne/Rng family ribonuclease [Phycisphaeraceae bacterium]|nr:MAG: Rne/Rng family ribonuclease [Phycisphaeraceae bacterium]